MKDGRRQTLAGMTLEQKLGQLMVSFLDDEADTSWQARGRSADCMAWRAGRVRETAERNADLQREAATPLLLCSDFETGSTVASGTPLPSAMETGATGDAEVARASGSVTAREVGAIGFRFMGSPELDINRPAIRSSRRAPSARSRTW